MSGSVALSCSEFLDAAAAYALGALDSAEQAACELHLATAVVHPVCLLAVAEARAVAVALAAALPVRAPRPELWTAVEARLRQDAPRAAIVAAAPPLASIASLQSLQSIDTTPPVELIAAPVRARVPTPTGCE